MMNYSPEDYDKCLCLKPSFGLYLTLVFGIKDLLLVILPALASFKSKSTSLDYLADLVQPEMFIADLIVLVVWLALFNRNPDSKAVWKNIWSKGRLMLIVAFGIHAAILLVEQMYAFNAVANWQRALDLKIIYLLAINLIFLANLLTSQRIKDTFADWPQKESAS